MPSADLEIVKDGIDNFKEMQEYMFLAKEENAEKEGCTSSLDVSLLEALLPTSPYSLQVARARF